MRCPAPDPLVYREQGQILLTPDVSILLTKRTVSPDSQPTAQFSQSLRLSRSFPRRQISRQPAYAGCWLPIRAWLSMTGKTRRSIHRPAPRTGPRRIPGTDWHRTLLRGRTDQGYTAPGGLGRCWRAGALREDTGRGCGRCVLCCQDDWSSKNKPVLRPVRAWTVPVLAERAKQCPSCGLVTYPRISPAIIVLIARGEEILLARSPRSRPGCTA